MVPAAPEDAAADRVSPGRRRVRRRISSPFRLRRRRQQLLTALVIAVIAAAAVAWFVSASVEDPEAHAPDGAIH